MSELEAGTVSGVRRLVSALALLWLPALGFVVAIPVALIGMSFVFDADSFGPEGDGVAVAIVLAMLIAVPIVSLLFGILIAPKLAFPRKPPRLVTGLLVGCTAWLAYAASWFLGQFADRGGIASLGNLIGGIAVAIALAAVLFIRSPKATAGVWAAAVVAIAGVAGAALLLTASTRQEFLGDQPALAFVDQESLDEVIPDWELTRIEDHAPWFSLEPSPRMTVVTENGTEISLVFSEGDVCTKVIGPCGVIGELADGSDLYGDLPERCENFEPQRPTSRYGQDWYVERPAGTWRLSARVLDCDELPSTDQLETFLNTLTPVTVEEWISST